MESQILSEFMHRTGANADDALSCLKTWGWDIKRAITDYNDTLDVAKENLDTFGGSEYGNQRKSEAVPTVVTRRPTLTKSDSIDIAEYRKLARGISRATDNINLVSLARSEIANDFKTKENELLNLSLAETPDYTFFLPNIFNYPDEFRSFLEKDLIECSTLTALEQSQCLNWWVERGICKKLWPLATTGDGNCLLHAASLGMWGFHDRKLTLRSALYNTLSKGQFRDALWRRWRFQQTRFNKAAGFVYSEIEWAKEWEELVSMSSPEPRSSSKARRRISSSEKGLVSADSIDDTAVYESLEEIHILALAHVLRRTIIVVADTVLRDLNGEAMAPITFGGIYFPFEIDAAECNRGPLLLAYDMAHFSALVPMDSNNDNLPSLIPLVSPGNVLMPIQFCIDPGENFNWRTYDGSEDSWVLSEREQVALLKEYLDVVYVPAMSSPEDEVFDDFTDEELDKRFSESEVIIPITVQLPSEDLQNPNKNKATKQLQSVARQFGSIGKNMGKKLRKNIGSITKIGSKGSLKGKNSFASANSTHNFVSSRVLCARLRIQRYDFQEEMIRNYLECARNRFLDMEKTGCAHDHNERLQFEMMSLRNPTESGQNLLCSNLRCNNIVRSENSYLCLDCCDNEDYTNSALRYGTGKSKFYTQVDSRHHDSIKNIPPARRLHEMDQTLYLSNSTFYNDQLPHANGAKSVKAAPTFKYSDFSPRVRLDESAKPPESALFQSSTQCKSPGCIFFGTFNTNYFCSKCYQAECKKRNSSSSPSSSSTDAISSPSAAFSTAEKLFPSATAAVVGKTNSKIMSDI